MKEKKYRLVTRSDFDGLVCAVLLKEINLIDDILFVHPKDMQDGKIEITESDITTNLPYCAACHLAFDHHESETVRRGTGRPPNHIIDENAPSAARVVYEHFGGRKSFPRVSDEMLEAVDKADSARFDVEDILHPQGWVLLSYVMDARTGLGRFRDFRVSNYQLMMHLIDYCREHTVDEILRLPDVVERTELYLDHAEKARDQIVRCSSLHGHLVVLDLRNEDVIYSTNRFMVYALYPDYNISMHVMWGLKKQNTVFALGNSIINRTSKVNIGALCLSHGGGGHANAGTCQIPNDRADHVLQELVGKITDIQGEPAEAIPRPVISSGP